MSNLPILVTFSFDKYKYIKLHFGVSPTGDMYHRLPNVFGIANDISIAGFDDLGRDHDETVDKVLNMWESQPKAQQIQVPFLMHQHSILWEKLYHETAQAQTLGN